MSKIPRQKMSELFPRSGKNRNFHYLSNPHNRFRLLEEPVELVIHFDTEGFTRCYRYDPMTKKLDYKKECRKCSNGQRSSKFYCLNAKNIDNGRIAILPLSTIMASEITKLASKEGVWPIDAKNGYSIDIYKTKNQSTNKNYWRVDKVRNEPILKADYNNRISVESAFGYAEDELETEDMSTEVPAKSAHEMPIEDDYEAEGVDDETEGFYQELEESEDTPILDDDDLTDNIPGLED